MQAASQSTSPRPLFWVSGAITVLGQQFADSEGTTFHSLEIRPLGGKEQRFTFVRAVHGIAALVKRNAIGTFFFWELPGERRPLVFRARGRAAVHRFGDDAENNQPSGLDNLDREGKHAKTPKAARRKAKRTCYRAVHERQAWRPPGSKRH